jgi:hypothetical protein
MKSREKFILVIAGLMLAYLIYALVSGDLMSDYKRVPNGNNKNTATVAQKNSTLESIKLVKDLKKSYQNELAVIGRSKQTLETDPFSSFSIIEASKTPKAEETVDTSKLIYSSYLSAEDKTIAVINSFEYAEGEEVIDMPFIVKKIYPDFIIVTSTSEKREYKVNFVNLTTN